MRDAENDTVVEINDLQYISKGIKLVSKGMSKIHRIVMEDDRLKYIEWDRVIEEMQNATLHENT